MEIGVIATAVASAVWTFLLLRRNYYPHSRWECL